MNSLELNYSLKQHWKLLLLIIFSVMVLGETIFQIIYPSTRLIPGVNVDGLNIGGMRKADAAKLLDNAYAGLKLDIYFGKNQAAFQSPKMKDVGVGVNNEARIDAMNYPMFLRFIPGSIFWAPGLQKPGVLEYVYDKEKIADYTTSKVGNDCSIEPQNATLKLNESQLELQPALSGGNCDITLFQQTLAKVEPDPDVANSIRIAINEVAAPVTDDIARDLAAKLNARLASPMPIQVDKNTDEIPGRVVMSWLDFTAKVPEKNIDNSANQQASLEYSVNLDRTQAYLNQGIAAKLIEKPGVSYVSTNDFVETSRKDGKSGREVDMPKVVKTITEYIREKRNKAIGATKPVGPTMVYKRSYTPTSNGFSALLAQYAQDNPGTWGLAFTELSGVRNLRSANYKGDVSMNSAGIHSLYLAYTYLMQKYDKISRPVDNISDGTEAIDCFKLMLQEFDTGCRRGFYNFFGFATINSRAKEIPLDNTVFAGDDTTTSANDLQKLLVGIYKNTIARSQDGQSILSTARINRNNDGIPAGSSGISVSHIIGESESMHNDTAIVYDSNYGAYALTVLSENSSWDKVAELAKKIHDLKMVEVPKDAT
ncbi:serine hydrolase [Candidatus Saccharibacteria bacterium]|nr:serine hydrolase [Candidatus Saccharibacteria bacterium]